MIVVFRNRISLFKNLSKTQKSIEYPVISLSVRRVNKKPRQNYSNISHQSKESTTLGNIDYKRPMTSRNVNVKLKYNTVYDRLMMDVKRRQNQAPGIFISHFRSNLCYRYKKN